MYCRVSLMCLINFIQINLSSLAALSISSTLRHSWPNLLSPPLPRRIPPAFRIGHTLYKFRNAKENNFSNYERHGKITWKLGDLHGKFIKTINGSCCQSCHHPSAGPPACLPAAPTVVEFKFNWSASHTHPHPASSTYLLLGLPLLHGRFVLLELVAPVWVDLLVVLFLRRRRTSAKREGDREREGAQ